MFERLDELESRYEEVQAKLADPSISSRPDQLRELGKQVSGLWEIVRPYRDYKKARSEAAAAKEMLASETDPEMRALVEQEFDSQEARARDLEERLRELMIPKDPNDDKNVLVEIKAGEGGEESALFAGDLYRMYQKYAELHGWRAEALASNPSDLGGFKDVTFEIKGDKAFSRLKHEAGVHRVQRVPETESQGRIHTSAVGVLVYPEADEVDVKVEPDDVRVDVFRSSGPGGQSVNTTDSAVRLTHLPTGMVVTCQDEKSQLQNREKAMRILRARLYQMELDRQQADAAATRKAQVRTVDRSEKVRTYNFPQNRVTDHRVGITVHNLRSFLEGSIDEIVDALIAKERTTRLSE